MNIRYVHKIGVLHKKNPEETNRTVIIYRSAKDNKVEEHGWPMSAYGVSKVGVRMMTTIQQTIMDQDKSRTDIIINCVSMEEKTFMLCYCLSISYLPWPKIEPQSQA